MTKIMKKIIFSNWTTLLLVVFSLVTIWPLFAPGYFSHHDDLHIIRIFEMRKCFADFQIPCRWVPDMGYGSGYPLFNYYNPFIYYLGAVLSYITGYIWASKILFATALILGPIGMYFLVKEFLGKLPGFVTAVVFMFAPYRALDAYVRGALAELFAISLIPVILLFVLRLIKQGKKMDFFVLTGVSGIFLTTHNISVILWSPLIFLWALFWLHKYKFANLKFLSLSLLLGLGLSAFFTIPAFFERNLVTTETLTRGDLDYHAHFAGINQLFFSRFWGYGASRLGPEDFLSLQIGWPHWWLAVMLTFLLIFLSIKHRARREIILPVFFVITFFASVFMMHNKSTPVWELFDILNYLQFPWRFLAVAIFSASLLGGFIVALIKSKYKYFISVLIVVFAVLANWNYFRPGEFYTDMNDQKKLTGELWEEQQKGAVLDYLPRTAKEPRELASGAIVIKGEAEIRSFIKGSDFWELEANIISNEAEIELPIFNFPIWGDRVDSQGLSYGGRVTLVLEKGVRVSRGFFKNTIIRSAANLITLTSFGVLIYFWKYEKNKQSLAK